MNMPKPIRLDQDTWLLMRSDPVVPKAVVQRVHSRNGDRFLLFKWALDPAQRRLTNVVDSLERANELVLFDVPRSGRPGPPNGRYSDGSFA
jgi:hypothetical protein